MSREYGVVVGEVVRVDDPQKEGRVKVKFPVLPGNSEAFWAPVATMMSGAGRGSLFLPEKKDEVLVGFANGDVAHPYILGYLWNGADKPPAQGINENVRRIQTVSGHTLDFDDNLGAEKIVVRSKDGHSIALTDAPSPSIRVETKNGHVVVLDDAGAGQIEARTKGGQRVTLGDGPGTITVKTNGGREISMTDAPPPGVLVRDGLGQIQLQGSPPTVTIQAAGNQVVIGPAGVSVVATGPLVLNCAQATVNAASALSINAPITLFSGPVITPTLITSSVLSPLYTPGVGNLLGL